MKPIIFTGDSFTFGEGLELYDEKYKNHVKSLTKIPEVDDDGNKVYSKYADYYYYNWARFEPMAWGGTAANTRNKLRFSTIVSETLDVPYFSPGENGYNTYSALDFVNRILEPNSTSDFSCVVMNMTYMWRDDLEYSKKWLHKNLNVNFTINNNHIVENSSLHKFLINWFTWNHEHGNKTFKGNESEYSRIFDGSNSIDINNAQILQDEYKTHDNFELEMQRLNYYNIIEIIKKTNLPFYFIGTWEKYDAIILKKLSNDSNIKENIIDKIIPIKVENKFYDNIVYENFLEYSNIWIYTEFPWTSNGHPTKKMHEYIGKSVSSYLKEIYI
tara:strand:+ start:26 stop:1012 length:987 start_codon:yes stop_codon:yes gene_type:complete